MSHDKAASLVVPGKLIDFLRKEGGRLGLSYNPEISTDEKWTAACEFGREADDSDMVGGAAYGVGRSSADAFGAMMSDLSL